MHIGNMHLNHRRCHRTNSILQSYGSMCIRTCIQNDAIHIKSYPLYAVYHFTLNIRLKIADLHVNVSFAKISQVIFKCNASVNGRLTLTQQINIRAINNLYLHRAILFFYTFVSERMCKGRKKKWKSTKKSIRRNNKS